MKTSDLSPELLLELLIRKIKAEIMARMPRLPDEPYSEYMEHIREEVEYALDEKVDEACERKFGKRTDPWQIYERS